MKKAVATILILTSLSILYYYGFVNPVILTSIPQFFDVLADVSAGQADFPLFIKLFGEALLAISVIFLSFGSVWIGLDMALSKDPNFRLVISRSSLVFLAVGGGLFFGARFAHAFAWLLVLGVFETIFNLLFAIAALEFTLTLLRYLSTDAKRYRLTIKLSNA